MVRLALLSVLAVGHAMWPGASTSAVRHEAGSNESAALAFTVYAARDGLSDEIWNRVGIDRDGFPWAGSASSLARFDGYRWVPWPAPRTRSLARDLLRDADGTLWANFEREGMFRWDGRDWRAEPVADGLIGRLMEVSGPDGQPRLVAGIANGFMVRESSGWRRVDLPPGAITHAVATTATLGGRPRQWANGATGLWVRDIGDDGDGPWQPYALPGAPSAEVSDLLRTVDRGRESLWVMSYGSGLFRIDDRGVRVWRAHTGELPSEALYVGRATTDVDGATVVWIASRGGLLRMRDDTITVFDRGSGLPSDAVRGIEVQRDVDGVDILWIATEGGIARAPLQRGPWRTMSLLGARFNGTVGVTVEDTPGAPERLWVGSVQDGLSVREAGTWRALNRANGRLPADGARQVWLMPGPDGKPWRLAALIGPAGLWTIDDALELRRFPVPWDGDPMEFTMFALTREVDGQREYWFATRTRGIYRWRGGAWTHFVLTEGPAMPVFRLSTTVDGTGRPWLWAATGNGLARFDGERWAMIGVEGLPNDGFRAATPIIDGDRTVLWLGATRSGLLRLDVTTPEAPRMLAAAGLPAPPDPTVYSVLPDSRGRIYVCTNNGVQLLVPRAEGGWREQVFRRRDGLVHDECNTNAQAVDRQDRYWVGTLGGLSMYDPRIQVPGGRTAPKPVRFTELRIDDAIRVIDPRSPVVVPSGGRQLRIDFTLLAGQREPETLYRSRLDGLEAGFTGWSPEHSRTWNRLPPGDYALEVEARDYAGTAGRAEPLRLRVLPDWWELLWVQWAAALALLLAAIGATLAYNRSLRTRQRQLAQEVAARTAELSDANAQLRALSYVDPLTGIANRRRLMEALDAALARGRERQLTVGLVVIDVDHFKQYNDRFGHPVGDIALKAIAQAIGAMVRPQDLFARYGGEEFICLVTDSGIDDTLRFAEQMRALVAALPPRMLGNDVIGLTLSAGVASRVPDAKDRVEDLLHEADAALYRAKQDGRNCVRGSRVQRRDAPG